MQQFHKVLNYL